MLRVVRNEYTGADNQVMAAVDQGQSITSGWQNVVVEETGQTTFSKLTPPSPKVFLYDLPDGRWLQREVWSLNGAETLQSRERYLWDGKVLLAILNDDNSVKASFLRGTDLSGSML